MKFHFLVFLLSILIFAGCNGGTPDNLRSKTMDNPIELEGSDEQLKEIEILVEDHTQDDFEINVSMVDNEQSDIDLVIADISINNPIDNDFAKHFVRVSSSMDGRWISGLYYNAWYQEWHNLVNEILDSLIYQEDIDALNTYRNNFNETVQSMSEVIAFEYTSTEEPVVERTYGSALAETINHNGAIMYKNETIRLINSRPWNKYIFAYQGIDLDELLNEPED